MAIYVQEGCRTTNSTGKENPAIKTLNAQNKERILKAVREKGEVTYKGRSIRITPDFSTENLNARRAWIEYIKTLREHK